MYQVVKICLTLLTIGKGCWASGSVLGSCCGCCWLLMSAAAAETTAPDMSKERFHLLGGGVRAELEEPLVGHGELSRVGGRLPGRLWAGGGLTCGQGEIIILLPEGSRVLSTPKNRVANDSRPGRLIDSKITVELKILVVIPCHDHAVVVD